MATSGRSTKIPKESSTGSLKHPLCEIPVKINKQTPLFIIEIVV